ncbi:FAD/NAD(P)-binding oxidoreductase [Conexibacter sp. S30A1]|uniref:NAD(P)/FAD-dependent oxidoreductase n=1 Tax=Conexibacter sp. S30A1 TaxID=2937800 RepID=UPI00200D6C81|nr:FAD-dependent oxidoreductase [Conexibacter sp. S30A1]
MHVIAIGGSDAGISTALRARELDPAVEVTVVAADAYPNFSICGIPYYISGEVTHWRNLAHRTRADLEATGMRLRLDTRATRIHADTRRLVVADRNGNEEALGYDALMIGTGALPIAPPIAGLDALGPEQGVHLVHSMDDAFALTDTLERAGISRAVIVGAGYIGLEMAEGLTTRGLRVTQIEQLPEVLPTVDPELGALVHAELEQHGVTVACGTRVEAIAPAERGERALVVSATGPDGKPRSYPADVVLVVVGVRPNSELAASAGVKLGFRDAIAVDRRMRTNLPHVYGAGDCVETHHRLLGTTYLPLGTTAHKQGRVAAENILGREREFAGSLGTQVVKVFDLVIARTGLRDHEAQAAGFEPLTVASRADDHKAYYPGSHPIQMRFTAERRDGRLLGLQLVGQLGSEVAKRADVAAAAIHNGLTISELSDLDLSYTPPLGSPWDAIQLGAQTWERAARAAIG